MLLGTRASADLDTLGLKEATEEPIVTYRGQYTCRSVLEFSFWGDRLTNVYHKSSIILGVCLPRGLELGNNPSGILSGGRDGWGVLCPRMKNPS